MPKEEFNKSLGRGERTEGLTLPGSGQGGLRGGDIALVREGCEDVACLRTPKSRVASVEGMCWEVKAEIYGWELRKIT